MSLDRFVNLPHTEARAAIESAIRESSLELARLSLALEHLSGGGDLRELTLAEPNAREAGGEGEESGVREAPAFDRTIDECIMQAAPGPLDPPIARTKLAMRAGYGYNRHFLAAVRKLLKNGLLEVIDGRVRRAA
jgi:hypothetical protein